MSTIKYSSLIHAELAGTDNSLIIIVASPNLRSCVQYNEGQ